jgi:O-glycosyl hydrolase
MKLFFQRINAMLLLCLLFTGISHAQIVNEITDDFSVEGGAHHDADQLVGSVTPIGQATWRSSKAYHDASFVLTKAQDMILDGRVKIPDSHSVLANGVDVPRVQKGQTLVVEYEAILNKASFAAVVLSADWDRFWGKASLLVGQIQKNGSVQLTYPGGKISLTGKQRPWWLLKSQPILMRLVYDTQANTVGFVIRGVPSNSKYPSTVLVAKDVKVPAQMSEQLATAGMFVNGNTAHLDNFNLRIGTFDKDPLDLPGTTAIKDDIAAPVKTQDMLRTKSDGKVTISVPGDKQQTFDGFGASVMGASDFLAITQQQHDQLAELVWKDLKFNTMRLWFYTWSLREKYGPDHKEFQNRYVRTNNITTAQKYGMNTLFFCGDGFPPKWTVKDQNGHTVIDQKYLKDYVEILVDVVDKARKVDGIKIGYVGLQNEPGAHDPFRPQDFPPAVKALRQSLDQRDLKDVKIVAPEMADAGPNFFRVLELMQADKQAWDALDVISAHSYGVASGPRLAQLVKNTGKQLWMTESSNAPPDDVRAACVSAGLCLNDLNHMAKRWLWFIAYAHQGKGRDRNGPRLIAFEKNPFKCQVLKKYYYFQAISHTFDVGAVFRKPVSSLDSDMHWKGKSAPPPHVTASVARNPDGTWGIALINYTIGPNSPSATHDDWPWPRRPGHPLQNFDVTIKIDELVNSGNLKFDVHRANKDADNQAGQSVVMKNGVVSVRVNPLELVVLRSE